jgi:hypothetical protein
VGVHFRTCPSCSGIKSSIIIGVHARNRRQKGNLCTTWPSPIYLNCCRLLTAPAMTIHNSNIRFVSSPGALHCHHDFLAATNLALYFWLRKLCARYFASNRATTEF